MKKIIYGLGTILSISPIMISMSCNGVSEKNGIKLDTNNSTVAIELKNYDKKVHALYQIENDFEESLKSEQSFKTRIGQKMKVKIIWFYQDKSKRNQFGDYIEKMKTYYFDYVLEKSENKIIEGWGLKFDFVEQLVKKLRKLNILQGGGKNLNDKRIKFQPGQK